MSLKMEWNERGRPVEEKGIENRMAISALVLKIQKITALGIPRRSPIQVLTEPDVA